MQCRQPFDMSLIVGGLIPRAHSQMINTSHPTITHLFIGVRGGTRLLQVLSESSDGPIQCAVQHFDLVN
jgi:hypothetical protein